MTAYIEYGDSAAHAKNGNLPFYCLSNIVRNEIPLHHHDYLELSYVAKGRGTETLNGITHELREGSVSLLLPHHIHQIRSSKDAPLHLYCLMFDINLIFDSKLDAEFGQLILQTGNQLPSNVQLVDADAQEMVKICKTLFSEYEDSKIGKISIIRSKVIEALVIFARCQSQTDLQPFHDSNPSTKILIWEIIQYVHTNYLNSLTQESLAQKFNVSSASVSRLFQSALQTHFLDYLHTLRIRRASSLLLTTDMSVYNISVESGFESFRTFSRVFKKEVGMTPSAFRMKAATPPSPG